MKMNVIIVGDAVADGLQPLTHHTSFLLLPVCGKAVIDHVLESLMPLAVDHVTLLVNEHSAKVRQFLGKGERWGMDVRLVTTLGGTQPQAGIQRYDLCNDAPTLIIDASQFRSFDVGKAICSFQEAEGAHLVGKFNGVACGLEYFLPNYSAQSTKEQSVQTSVELVLEFAGDLSTLSGYQEANFWVAEKKPNHVLTRGKQKHSNVVTGPGSTVSENNVQSGVLFTGIACRLHSDVCCNGVVVLGNNVIVDRHTSISNSIVLDETYIGEHLKIENSIVWRNSIIRVDTGAFFTLEDDRLIGNLSKTAFKTRIGGFIGRTLAAAVMLASSPLWLLAMIDALASHGFKPLSTHRYIGNGRLAYQSHQELTVKKIRSRYRMLANLPILWEMSCGKINWFGVSVCKPEALLDRSESWQFIRDSYPVGLLGPAQLELEDHCTSEERLLADATWIDYSRTQLIHRAIQKLLSYESVAGESSKVSSR